MLRRELSSFRAISPDVGSYSYSGCRANASMGKGIQGRFSEISIVHYKTNDLRTRAPIKPKNLTYVCGFERCEKFKEFYETGYVTSRYTEANYLLAVR